MSTSRQLAAIMFTDIVGYTAMMGKDEQRALGLLHKNRDLQRPLIEGHGGKWVKEMGDGVLAQFRSAYDSIQCALKIQEAVNESGKFRLRIGIHLGDITTENDDAFGDGVNIAARIQAAAEPGSIYISGSIREAVKARSEINTAFLGQVTLKNVANPVPIYAIVGEGLPQPKPGKQRTSKVPRLAALAIVGVLILAMTALWFDDFFTDRAAPAIQTIAVLPFENLSNDPDQEYFADGMTETLIANLAKINSLKVISRTSAMSFKNTTKTLPEIARELKADAVVEGSVIREGDRVRITAQLIRADQDVHLWAEQYDRDLRNILKLHSEVAQSIAAEIQIVLTPLEEALLSNAPVVNPEAYEAYLMGRFHLYQLTPDHYQKALEYYQRALDIDPNYGLAHAGISLVWIHRGQWAGYNPHEAAQIGKDYAFKALAIDSSLSEIHLALAHVYTSYEWDWDMAIAEYDKAIQLSPNDPEPRLFLGDLLLSMNKPSMALSQIRTAVAVDPLNAFSYSILGWGLYATRQYQEAIKELEKSMGMEVTIPLSLRCLWSIYHIQGKELKSIKYAGLFYDTQGMPEVAVDLEEGYKKEGYLFALNFAASRLEERSSQVFIPSMRIARLYAQAGQVEKAVELLEKSYNERFPSMFSLNVDPDWDPLKESERFQVLLGKMNFPD